MYDDFRTKDRWTGEEVHISWIANIVAIATRHADAVDIKFLVNDRPVWIALPCPAWTRFFQETGHQITDRLATQIAGRFLKQAIESGLDNQREMYNLTIEETLEQLHGVMDEAKHTDNLPILPRIHGTGNAEVVDERQVQFSPHGTVSNQGETLEP
jgi:hypothetical protein